MNKGKLVRGKILNVVDIVSGDVFHHLLSNSYRLTNFYGLETKVIMGNETQLFSFYDLRGQTDA